MIDADVGRTLGFDQMHEAQREAFMDLVSVALLAASETGNQHMMDKVTDVTHETVRLFGGMGIFKDYC